MNRLPETQLDQNKLIQLVTEMVLGKIASKTTSRSSNSNGNRIAARDQVESVGKTPDELFVDQKLVTTENLPSGWRDAKTIRFARQTIVTPAVFDLLNARGLSFTRCTDSEEKAVFGPQNAQNVGEEKTSFVGHGYRGSVVMDPPGATGFGWLKKVCQSFQLQQLEWNGAETLEKNQKHLILSEQPFALQKQLADFGIHSIVGCKDFSETFDRMAYSHLLVMPARTASWTIRQILKSWDHFGCQSAQQK